MSQILIRAFIFLLTAQLSWAEQSAPATPPPTPEIPPPASVQHPAVRPLPPDDPGKESSSFIGDSENLDPLRARRDSLKDDNEPVLDDIKQVLDAPAPKPVVEKSPENFTPSTATKKIAKPPKLKKIAAKKKSAKPKKIVKLRKQKQIEDQSRNSDDPDQVVEKRFYQNYMRYNSEPTPSELWSAATFGRSAEVYIVQKGDTLWTISETLFGDSLFWPKIWALNRQGIVNPHYILPGMRVNFYPGTADDVPTLGLGEKAQNRKTEVGDSGPESSVESSPDEADMYRTFDDSVDQTPQQAQHIEPDGSATEVIRLNSKDKPTRIPPSIPLYRSQLYFGELRKVDIIDLEPPEKIPTTYQTDIFLTDRLVLSDLKISQVTNNLTHCAPGEVIENVQFIRRQTTDEYTVLTALDKVQIGKNSFMYPYKKVGTIAYYEGKLKIKDCNLLLGRDQIFVPSAVLQSLKSKKTSQGSPQILGGPAIINQNNFYPSQNVYIDMGGSNFESGQNFDVKSKRIDDGAGQVKILDRFGSYAVGIILDETKPIQAGDEVIIK